MAEELVVDPLLLEAAAAKLGELVYPAPLAPIVVPAEDPVSAAINETLPVIESPVINALPAIKAANTRTSSSLAIAAGIYADTDRRLADHVSQAEVRSPDDTSLSAASKFLPGAEPSESPDGVTTHPLVSAALGEKQLPEGQPPPTLQPGPDPAPAAPLPGFDLKPAPLGQINGVAGAMGPATQSVQAVTSSVQGAVQGATAGTGTPAQLADANTMTGPGDQAQLTDETTPESEGAASGEQASANAPVLAPSTSRSQTAASGIEF
ncbi:hypothetical protein ACX9NE_14110 [Mycobacterium sp. ML4]